MKAATWTSRHARSVLFVLIALVACGVLAAKSLPVSLFPHVNFPRVRVNVESGDRPAEQTERQVTRVLEQAVGAIPGVRGVESATTRGSAEISIAFDWGQDMTAAYLQTQAAVTRVLPTLPAGTTFDVRRMDPTVFPVIAYSVTSATRPLTELRDLAQQRLLPALSRVDGVARATVDGGATAEIHVVVDAAKLAAQGLAVSDLSAALAAANTLSAAGRVEDRNKLYLVITDAQLHGVGQIADTVLKAGPDGVVRVRDVAAVSRGVAPQATNAVADGRTCVLLNVYQPPDGNTVRIAAGIRDALAAEARRLPPDVTVTCWYDQSDLITSSVRGVRDAVLIGVVLATLVLLLFLRDWRMTLIAALAVPLVLAVASLVLWTLGQSLNVMTLGGMAAAVGLIIDDAIVISEHIVRRLQERRGGTAADTQIAAAADEFTRPLVGSSLSTIVIHIPPAFLIGVFGAFFAALSLAMAACLVVSFFVAWLVIPLLARRLLRNSKPAPPGRVSRVFENAYAAVLSPLLRVPAVAVLIAAPLLFAGYVAFGRVPSGVMPTIDEGGFVIDYVGPAGASIPEMDRLLGHVEKALAETPEVLTYSRRTGFSLGGDLSETHTGDFFVRLKPLPRQAIGRIMDELHERVSDEVPGLEIEPLQLMEDLLGDLTGRPQPVVVNLFGSDEHELVALSEKIVGLLGRVGGLSSIESSLAPSGDSLTVTVDRVKAAQEGVDPDVISRQAGDLIAGSTATQVVSGEKTIDVRVLTPPKVRRTGEDLLRLPMRAPDGHLFPLGRVATLATSAGGPQLTRQDLQRVVAVTARSSRDLGRTVRDVRAALDRPGVLPPAVRYTLGGQYQEQQLAFTASARVAAAGAALVFLLLLMLYERLRVAAAILLTVALAIAAVFVGLWLTGTELNISSLMGLVMIIGNVTEVAIFYYSEYVALPPDSGPHRRLADAGRHRLRAITMTTLAAVLALAPLAVDFGHTAGLLRPMAIAIIAGLAVQLPLVLFVLPMFLALFRVDAVSVPAAAPPLPGDS